MDKLESPSEDRFEKIGKKYITKCVLKMGCNKCTEVFYSDDSYKHHLYKTHCIKNINKYPPIIINRQSQTLKDVFVKLKKKGGVHCPSCNTGFNTEKGLEQHSNTCYKRPVEQKEESPKYLYESFEKGGFDPISDDNESKDDIKKEKHSTNRKHKRGKTSFTPKKRKATSSTSKSSHKKKAKTFSKKTPEDKFGEEGDDSKGVEFYQKALTNTRLRIRKKSTVNEIDDSKDEDYTIEYNEEMLNAEEEKEEDSVLAKFTALNRPSRPRTRSMKNTAEEDEPLSVDDEVESEIIDAKKGKKTKEVKLKKKNTKAKTEEISEVKTEVKKSAKTVKTTKSANPTSKQNKSSKNMNTRSKSLISDKKTSKKGKADKVKDKSGKEEKADKSEDIEEKEEADECLCQICNKSMSNNDNFKKHKVSCTKIPKNHVCSKCGKSFSQKTLLNQHFDYRHTNKPKRFVCHPCKRSFELKKTLAEHNRRLHNPGDAAHLCDICSRGFWHIGEFQLQRASHTGVKPFQCGRCKEKSFSCAERLTKHLKTCGITNQYECSHCGKRVSTPKALSIHISEVHLKDCSLKCPFCEDKHFSPEAAIIQFENKTFSRKASTKTLGSNN